MDFFQNEGQFSICCSISSSLFPPTDQRFVLIYDNKYLMMQVLLCLSCSNFVSNMYLDKCLLSVQVVSQNETSQVLR